MSARAITVFNSSFIGSSVGSVFLWDGGRAALVLTADQYGSGVFLQLQNRNGAWATVNGTTFSANQVTGFDLPAGQVRMMNNVGSSINLCAALIQVPY